MKGDLKPKIENLTTEEVISMDMGSDCIITDDFIVNHDIGATEETM